MTCHMIPKPHLHRYIEFKLLRSEIDNSIYDFDNCASTFNNVHYLLIGKVQEKNKLTANEKESGTSRLSIPLLCMYL